MSIKELKQEKKMEIMMRLESLANVTRAIGKTTGSIYAETEIEKLYDVWILIDTAEQNIRVARRMMEEINND